MIKIIGIDMAAERKKTAACLLTFENANLVNVELHEEANDDLLHKLIKNADAIGIDAPFGWPEAFRDAVCSRTVDDWANKEQLRLRETDRETKRLLKKKVTPISVSSDKIAVTAMRAMSLLHRYAVTDKSGASCFSSKRFFEVYPAASLACWDIDRNGYKDNKDIEKRKSSLEKRKKMLVSIAASTNINNLSNEFSKTDHNLDSLIAALTAFAAIKGQTILPSTPEQQKLAENEGWIHLPKNSLNHLFHQ